jgi:hypothetical protein
MSDPTIEISDHAVLRLLERRYGLNSELFRDEIRRDFARGEFTHDGLQIIVRDFRIVTVQLAKGHPEYRVKDARARRVAP